MKNTEEPKVVLTYRNSTITIKGRVYHPENSTDPIWSLVIFMPYGSIRSARCHDQIGRTRVINACITLHGDIPPADEPKMKHEIEQAMISLTNNFKV